MAAPYFCLAKKLAPFFFVSLSPKYLDERLKNVPEMVRERRRKVQEFETAKNKKVRGKIYDLS